MGGTISNSFFVNIIEDGTFPQQVWKKSNSQPSAPATSQSDAVPSGWKAAPTGVDEKTKNEWVSMRTKTDGVWSAFSTPALYSRYAEDGRSISISGSFTKEQVESYVGHTDPTDADIRNYLAHTYPSAQQNDGYIYTYNGHFWVYNGSSWGDVGQIQGPKGDPARYLIVDNNNITLLYSSGGTRLSSEQPINVRFAHDGIIDDAPSATFSPSAGVTGQSTGTGKYKVTGCTNTSGKVDISFTYDGQTYSAIVNVTRTVGKDVYDLIVNPISIPYNSTTDSPATTAITIQAYRTSVDGTYGLVESLPSGMQLRRYDDGGSTPTVLTFDTTNHRWSFSSDNSAHSKYRFVLVSSVGTEDAQEIAIVKSSNGSNGQNAVQLTLDNEHEDFIYSEGERVAPSSVTTQAHLYNGNTEIPASSISWTINLSRCTGIDLTKLSFSNGTYTLTGISAQNAKLCIQATYGGNTYEAMFTCNQISQDKYDLLVRPSAIAYNPATYTTQTISVSARKTNLTGAQSTAYIAPDSTISAGQLRLFYAWVNSDGTRGTLTQSNAVNIQITAANCASYVGIYLELRLYKTSSTYDVKDGETVEFAKSVNGENGDDGQNAKQLDLTNQNDALQYMGDVNLTGSITSKATLYDGGVPVLTGVTFSTDSSSTIPVNYYTLNAQTGAITVTGLPSGQLSGKLVVVATYQGETFSKEMTVQRLDNGEPKFELVIDKPAVVQNTSQSTATIPINIKVFKTYIDTSVNRLVRVQLTSLAADGLRVYSVTTAGASNMTRNYGASGVTYNANPSQWTGDVTFHVTNNQDWGSSSLVSYDYETIPIAAVGSGQQGKMGRNIYLAGTLNEVKEMDGFTVTDTSAPYVQVGLGTNNMPKCYVFDGPNGNYQFPTSESDYQSDPNWELMVSDFKYLMTKAIFSDFAKLGSGIFNGDYAFSQWGTDANGQVSTYYQNFMPFCMNLEVMVTAENTYDHSVILGSFSVVSGRSYKFTFELDVADNNIVFYPWGVPSSASAQGWHSTEKYFTREWTAQSSTTITMRVFNNGSNTRYVKVQVVDTTFKPNLYIDWLKGEIYAQLGRFVNVTIEGVLNNLIQDINSTNISSFGNWNSTNNKLELNPLKIGSLVRFSTSADIYLPCAFYGQVNETWGVYTRLYGLTMEELRQCVGKQIKIFPSNSVSVSIAFYSGIEIPNANNYGMLIATTVENEIPSTTNQVTQNVKKTRTWEYKRTDQSNNHYMTLLECKMGIFNGNECIYWEIRDGYVLDYTGQ